MRYSYRMLSIRTTATFDKWLTCLRDREARARIQMRIDRLQVGNPGDAKPIGTGVSEMRIHYGPGYRVYFAQRGTVLVILLCGGDKSTQKADIDKALALAANLDVE